MNNYTVYMHISPSGKRYIGITSQEPKKRWGNGCNYKKQQYFYRAIEKYGWDNFEHIIVAKGLDEETAKWLEIELIKVWNTTDRNKGYNITLGGEGCRGINPLDYMTKEQLEEWKRKQSEAHKGKNNPSARVVICITTEKIFYTAKEGAEYYNCQHSHIIACCKVKALSAGKLDDGTPLAWMYLEDYENATEEEIIDRINKANEVGKGKNHPQAKSVICLTTKGIFNTAKDGAKYYGIKNSGDIGQCCKGKRKSCGRLQDGTPLVWKYLNYKHNKTYRVINKLKRIN